MTDLIPPHQHTALKKAANEVKKFMQTPWQRVIANGLHQAGISEAVALAYFKGCKLPEPAMWQVLNALRDANNEANAGEAGV